MKFPIFANITSQIKNTPMVSGYLNLETTYEGDEWKYKNASKMGITTTSIESRTAVQSFQTKIRAAGSSQLQISHSTSSTITTEADMVV